jgi:Ca2+-transporting ATPase
MGQRGTDVAREAAEVVLLDDSFTTIVTAVHEGRRIFDDIRKFIRYTMTSNSGEIWVLVLAPLLGMPLPLLPLHILWINLVTDGLPGLALSAEPAEKDVMKRKPRPPEESIFADGMAAHILWVGLLIGGLTLATQAWTWYRDQAGWQTMVFTVLVFAQLCHCLAIRSERFSLFSIGLISNPALLGAVLLTVLAQMAVIYLPMLNAVFRTVPLSLTQLATCFGIGSIVFVAVELEKFVRRGARD